MYEKMYENVFNVKSKIKAAPQKCVLPKEKEMLCLLSFGVAYFWGAAFISEFTLNVLCINLSGLLNYKILINTS